MHLARPTLLVLALVLAAPLAACSNDPVNVTYEGFSCSDVPGLDDYFDAMDTDGDNRISSDEYNSSFDQAMNEVTPDGQLDRNELANYVCQKKQAKAAAAAAAGGAAPAAPAPAN